RKFIAIVCATFFARVSPVSTRANPSCMNITRNPVSRVHTMLSAVCESASCLARSAAFMRAHRPSSNVSVLYRIRCDGPNSGRVASAAAIGWALSEGRAAALALGQRLQGAARGGTQVVQLERIDADVEASPVGVVLRGENLLRLAHCPPVLERTREDAAAVGEHHG